MSNDLTPFDNGEFQLGFSPDGDSFKVRAPGLAKALGFREAFDLLRGIPEDEKGSELVRTPGGEQRIGYVTEAGFYRALGQRQAARIPDASLRDKVARFQSWVYGEVLPAVRRGERPGKTQWQVPASFAEALELAARQARELDEERARNAVLEPAAQAWDELVDVGTTLDIAAAAKKLREAGVLMGRTRLYAYLREIGWVFVYGTQPKQAAVDTGWVTVDWGKPYVNAKTGETEQGDAKTRVTPKGLAELLRRLAPNEAAS